MSLEVMIKDVEKELFASWEVYINAHKDLQKYAGKELKNFSQEEINECNEILSKIQDTFKELYPALNFAAVRSEWAKNAINGYNDFIENIKKNGAKEAHPEENGQPKDNEN